MKGVIILGGRNKEGLTAQAARALGSGAGDAMREVSLASKRIERCRQCGADGWGPCLKEGRCAIPDDFSEVLGEIEASDFAVFATPVYFGDLSECMQAFLGRLRRISHKKERKPMASKPALGVCVAGGGGDGVLSCAERLEGILLQCGFRVLDVVPVRRQDLDPRKKSVLKNLGGWMASVLPASEG